MDFELISDEEYESLPEDDEQCFVAFESICRRKMKWLLHASSTSSDKREVCEEYMVAVAAVGIQCSIPNVVSPSYDADPQIFWEAFGSFSSVVQGEVVRIKTKSRRGSIEYSVLLLPNTREKVEFHISQIRQAVHASLLNESRKAALNRRLDDLVQELSNRRVRYNPVMAALMLLTSTLAAASNATTIAADGQAAITAIIRLLGIDKQSEDAATARLAAPQQALPAPTSKPQPPSWEPPDNLDDEIQF